MSHVAHIYKNKAHLVLRSHIIRLMREFFWSEQFLEVETPILLRLPGQEPYLSPMKINMHNERGDVFSGFLHTSPEYTMKKMLAAGFENIFSLTKTFRDYESFGGTHNPEFTMIEWYRNGKNMFDIMADCERLFAYVMVGLKNYEIPHTLSTEDCLFEKSADSTCFRFTSPSGMLEKPWESLHMRDLWRQYVDVNLDEYLTDGAMRQLCVARGYTPGVSEPYEDLFYRIFLNEIEPHLGKDRPLFIHHYPKQMAALARIDPQDELYAERFEIYIDGLEIANAFSELTDPKEQRIRLLEEQRQREVVGKDVFPLDEEFLEALGLIDQAAGIALGVDRMVQLFLGCKNINDVIALPASTLFEV